MAEGKTISLAIRGLSEKVAAEQITIGSYKRAFVVTGKRMAFIGDGESRGLTKGRGLVKANSIGLAFVVKKAGLKLMHGENGAAHSVAG